MTITKAEYDNLVAEKAERARLERQVEYLLEQMRLSRHRQFGASSEKSEYDLAQLNLFNEAEVMADPEQPEPELKSVCCYALAKPFDRSQTHSQTDLTCGRAALLRHFQTP